MLTKNTPKAPVTVGIVEDHLDYRTKLRGAINSTSSLHCLIDCSNIEDLFAYINEEQVPEMIILDLAIPDMDSIDGIPKLREAAPDTTILVLTESNKKAQVFQALGSGASGYLIKSDDMDVIMKAIKAAQSGIALLSNEIAEMVFATFSSLKPINKEAKLSGREIDILQRLAHGLHRQEVADKLFISVHTVHTHVRTVYKKLKVHNLPGALNKATQMGLI